MAIGRPKNPIPRDEKLTLRLTKSELEKISRVAKQKEISRTDALLQGIDLLEKNKPKRFANLKELYKKRHNGQEPPPGWFD